VASQAHPTATQLKAPKPQEAPEELCDATRTDSVATASKVSKVTGAPTSAIKPPESIDPPTVYTLYRGVTGSINGQDHRIWVEFTAVELCWARYDTPARRVNRLSLLHLTGCRVIEAEEEEDPTLSIFSFSKTGGMEGGFEGEVERRPMLQVRASSRLQEFGEALEKLIKSRETEGKTVLEFIRRRLFQYLWVRQGHLLGQQGDQEIYEAQAVLAFNLEPKEGVAYLREKLQKTTDIEVGEWLAHMSINKGGIDPTLLGNYFSRRDTIEVTKTFVSKLSFHGVDIVGALRRLFDTFKPGGESQVIARILETFAEAYLSQWAEQRQEVLPIVHYSSADSVLQVAMSLIMLNTSLHVLPKKMKQARRKSCCRCCVGKPRKSVGMTVNDYIRNARYCVSKEEVPDEALRRWYDVVRDLEISVEPLPRVPFSTLPVQPDIEGWLTAVLGPRIRRRVWAVLALQRLYLFSDSGKEIEPGDTLNLKDFAVCSIARDVAARERLRKEQGGFCLGACLAAVPEDLPDMVLQAFELRRFTGSASNRQSLTHFTLGGPRDTVVLVAETPDLMERWVNLISAGAFH